MKVITGTVSHVRNTACVSGNQHGVGTTQVLGFRIGRQAVELRMPNLPPIEEGDSVSVAGDLESGTLIARAFRNFDNNSHGHWTHSWKLFTATSAIVFLPGLALFAILFLRGSTDYPFAILIYLVPFSPFPFWADRRAHV